MLLIIPGEQIVPSTDLAATLSATSPSERPAANVCTEEAALPPLTGEEQLLAKDAEHAPEEPVEHPV